MPATRSETEEFLRDGLDALFAAMRPCPFYNSGCDSLANTFRIWRRVAMDEGDDYALRRLLVAGVPRLLGFVETCVALGNGERAELDRMRTWWQWLCCMATGRFVST